MKSAWLLLGMVCFLDSQLPTVADEMPGRRSLILSPGIALSDPARLAGLDCVILPLPDAGPSVLTPSAIHPVEARDGLAYEGLADWVGRCHSLGIEVLGAVELLRWDEGAGASGLREEHPAWYELDRDGACSDIDDPAVYASVWAAEVRAASLASATHLVEALPELDGLLIGCSYSRTAMRGYSDQARAAYVSAASIDPIDLNLTSELPGERELVTAWYKWRQDSVSTFLQLFSAHCRTLLPGVHVVGWASPHTYRGSPRDRGKACNEWASWLLEGTVDSVFLEGPWIASATEEGQTPPRLYAAALGLLSRMDPLPMFVPTIPTEFAGEEVDIAAQLAQLRSEGPVPALGIVVRKPEHLEAALEALRNFEPDEI